MKVKVSIGGKSRPYDLTRVSSGESLARGDQVIVKNPATDEWCRAVASFDIYNRLWVTDTARGLSPQRWCIQKSGIRNNVYKINK